MVEAKYGGFSRSFLMTSCRRRMSTANVFYGRETTGKRSLHGGVMSGLTTAARTKARKLDFSARLTHIVRCEIIRGLVC